MMIEKYEYKGFWFLPNKESEKVAGILKYESGQISLELIGSLLGYKNPVDSLLEKHNDNAYQEIIHGYSSNGKKITLLNCRYTHGSHNFSCDFPIESYTSQYIIIGLLLDSKESKEFDEIKVENSLMSYFVHPKLLRTSLGDNCLSIKTELRKMHCFEDYDIGGDYKLKFYKGVNYKGDNFKPVIEQLSFFGISHDLEKSDFLALAEKARLFNQFLSIATLNDTTYPQYELRIKNDNGEDAWYSLFIRNNSNKIETKIEHHELLIKHDNIKSQFARIIKKWYQIKDNLAPIKSHLLDSISKKSTFDSGDFLIIVQALEGYHTRFLEKEHRKEKKINANTKISLNNRLTYIVENFETVTKIKSLYENVNMEEIVATRDYYSHLFQKEKKKHLIKDVNTLYQYTRKLRLLLICCVLELIGFDKNTINSILQNNHSNITCL
ncbi:hypothetical protein LJC45_03155 [Alistipes sp. OttesenSCG-928-B03]|nr:hypothetical protein [Alistipes sp. OttesenSCG-928-B03]